MHHKWFLYATAFFSGMSVMAVELGASRLLAPYFSSSQIVWTVIIGTIMIALAVGNVIGGRMADKRPDPSRLYTRLIIAAIWIAAIPFAGKYVIAGVSFLLALFVTKQFLVWASLVSCLALFVFPLVLLGTVSPALTKFAVGSLEENGKVVGELEALNTIGSIIGTFLPTFVTIPTVGTAMTFLIFAAVLAVLSLIYFISIRRHIVRGAAAVGLIAVLMAMPYKVTFAFWEEDIVYEGESIYNYLQVKEDAQQVILSTNVLAGVQSIWVKSGGLTDMYYDYALAGPMMAGMNAGQGGGRDVLLLGLGTGTYAKQCVTYFPGASVVGVEIDSKIATLARQYFDLPQQVEVVVDDGRAYLGHAGLYDVILVDAYQDITIPFQMSSVEFFMQVRSHLKPGGVMVVNMNMRSSREGAINDYLCDTIAQVFDYVYTCVVTNATNTVLFACQDGGMLERMDAAVNAMAEGELKVMMGRVRAGLERQDKGPLVLTDDKAPVELLGMRVIDDIIMESVADLQDIIRSGNWKDLLGLLG
nr:fused MFS/spermidine synthase [bacterium]